MEFDVSSMARRYRRSYVLFGRFLALTMAGLGALFFLIGVGYRLGNLHCHSGCYSPSANLFLLLVGGSVLIGAGVVFGLALPAVANRVGVAGVGFQMTLPNGRVWTLGWDALTASTRIIDFRAVPSVARVPSMRGIDFLFIPSRRVVAPIPIEAAATIIEEARRHGLTATGSLDPPLTRGPQTDIRFENLGSG